MDVKAHVWMVSLQEGFILMGKLAWTEGAGVEMIAAAGRPDPDEIIGPWFPVALCERVTKPTLSKNFS